MGETPPPRLRLGDHFLSPVLFDIRLLMGFPIEMRPKTMPNEPIDYEVVVADLEAKRAALDTVIAALRLALNMGATIAPGGAPSASPTAKPIDPATIRDDAFFGLSIGEAAKRYLEMVRRKQSIKEIADALERGGLPHTSSNFVNTVSTMMNRAAKADPELVRVGRGEWGLAGWYGNRRPKPPEPPKRTRAKRKERKSREGASLKAVLRKDRVSGLTTGMTVSEPEQS
jgi:hypothetical protein